MNITKATKILKKVIQERNDGVRNGIYPLKWYLFWEVGDNMATLNGKFTAETLQAIACWMKYKSAGDKASKYTSLKC